MDQAEEDGEEQETAGCERHQTGAVKLGRQLAGEDKTWIALDRRRPPGFRLMKTAVPHIAALLVT